MNNAGNYLLVILTTAVIVAGGLFYLQYGDRREESKGPSAEESLGDINRFTSLTGTMRLCDTTSSEILGTSTGRQYVGLTNNSTTTDAYISFGDHAVDRKDIFLGRSGGSLEINLDNLYTGALFCIASSTVQIGIISK